MYDLKDISGRVENKLEPTTFNRRSLVKLHLTTKNHPQDSKTKKDTKP